MEFDHGTPHALHAAMATNRGYSGQTNLAQGAREAQGLLTISTHTRIELHAYTEALR